VKVLWHICKLIKCPWEAEGSSRDTDFAPSLNQRANYSASALVTQTLGVIETGTS